MFDFIYTLFGYQEEEKNIQNNPVIITPSLLQKVVLKPVNIQPAFARNMPKNSYSLIQLSKEQLQDIIQNTLKPIPTIKKKQYVHRHPVLRELLEKTQIVL